jgi:large subunit ribosomal protein L4
MAEVQVYDMEGKGKASRQLDSRLFNMEVKPHLIHEYVVGYLRNQRQGNASTRTRNMVRGGGRKPWRQKGTGRARAGSNNSPLWVGGGVAWGPSPKDHYRPLPKKLKRAALQQAFSHVAAEGRLRIIELPQIDKPKTRQLTELLKLHDVYHRRVLLLFEGQNKDLELSCRNIKWLNAKRSILVNPVDLVWAEHVLITAEALDKVEEVFGG